ncbi:hypothetical protein K503DRAFT_860957 [Rhizopogon vinicolor AM-OR11-026]|uniref:Uncharacterized protein n=1 Tax=Rhizopogon vinicolor AM-OR11-026 TaxID=1314800 RepID=A0A1B7MDS4_9AGAM|nr:hypothetical protein K503DRAFT_860957 [Rhizopogon vinicolor AM-OR11-026]
MNEGKNVDQSDITDKVENIDKGKARDKGDTIAEDEDESKTYTCDVFDLQEYAKGMVSLGINVGRYLVVREEYISLRQELTTMFGPRDNLEGVAVLGQPGIRKSLFLVYLLLTRMQGALPVTIEVTPHGYYFINNNGVSFHGNSDGVPLEQQDKAVWCLSDSNEHLIIPSQAFIHSPNIWIIQAASPRKESKDRWHDWTKMAGHQQLFMDVWEEEELALLTEVQFGRQHLATMFRISSQWGPSPNHIVLALRPENLSTWENYIHSIIEAAAEGLHQENQIFT